MGVLPGQDIDIVDAREKHAGDILGIYQRNQIKAEVFSDLASNSVRLSTLARKFLKNNGGFLCPPDEEEMAMTLQHGLGLVVLKDGKVVGFNRSVTNPLAVQRLFCAEYQLDDSNVYVNKPDLTTWSGSKQLNTYKVLKRVYWTDKQQAVVALKAVRAGLEHRSDGKLVWALDAGVLPEYRRLGICRMLSDQMKQTLALEFSFRAYKIFEIRKINGADCVIDNERSKSAFVNSDSRHFAYTEEDIMINDDICVTVRWNHWLRYY
jgi:hypothetical protein